MRSTSIEKCRTGDIMLLFLNDKLRFPCIIYFFNETNKKVACDVNVNVNNSIQSPFRNIYSESPSQYFYEGI